MPKQTSSQTRSRIYYQRMRTIAHAILGNACVRCGENDTRCLQVDHILGDGAARRRTGGDRTGHTLYRNIVRAGRNGPYQLLCANCNWIKVAENGESQHGCAVIRLEADRLTSVVLALLERVPVPAIAKRHEISQANVKSIASRYRIATRQRIRTKTPSPPHC